MNALSKQIHVCCPVNMESSANNAFVRFKSNMQIIGHGIADVWCDFTTAAADKYSSFIDTFSYLKSMNNCFRNKSNKTISILINAGNTSW